MTQRPVSGMNKIRRHPKPHLYSTPLHLTNPAEEGHEDKITPTPPQAETQFPVSPQGGALSPASPSRAHRMELLKSGSPKSKTLENLRERILQQKLERIPIRLDTEMTRPGHITRKVCRVTSKGARTVPGTAGVMGLSGRKASISLSSTTTRHLNMASQCEARRKKEHFTYISAWKDAQKLVKEVLDSHSVSASESQKDPKVKSTPKARQQIGTALQQKAQNDAKPKSNQKRIIEKTGHYACGKAPITPITKSSPALKTPLTVRRKQNSSKHAKPSQVSTTLSSGFHKPAAARLLCLKGRENESPSEQSSTPRQNAQAVREYMHQQVLERRSKEQQMKKEAQLEKERKRRKMQDVLEKQKKALQRMREQQRLGCENKSAEKKTGHVVKEKDLVANGNKTLGQPQNNEGTRCIDWFPDAQAGAGRALCQAESESQISLAETQRHRLEDLRKMITLLDTRLESEAIQQIQKGFVTPPRPNDTADRNKEKDPVPTNGCTPKNEVNSVDQQACPLVEKCGLQNDRATLHCTSEQSDVSESSDSTSKWSELSEEYGQNQLRCSLLLAQSQQFLREEELRARQYSALFRLREKALWERTQAELAWLEHCKMHVTSEDDAVAEIKRQQEDVVSRLRQEKAEIHHWRNLYKCGRQQRRLLLCHQRDILDIERSSTHFRQVLENQATAEPATRPKDIAPVPEGKSFIEKPGIIPAARSGDKLQKDQGRFLTKAGLRRLLTSDEVWSFGRKRSSGEHISTDQETLQTGESKDLCDSKHFSTCGHQSRPCHHASSERTAKVGDGRHLHQQESVKLDSKTNGYDPETEKNIQIPLHKGQHLEKVKPPKNSDIYSGEKLKYPTEVPWVSIKNVQCFTSGEQNQPCSGTAGKPPMMSSLSSDIEEDLPYDYEDSQEGPAEEAETKLQETLKTLAATEDGVTLDHGLEITDNITFSVQNYQKSQTAMLLNNNQEICNESKRTGSNAAYTQTPEPDLVKKDSITDKPIITNWVQTLSSDLKRGEESASCDDSLSEDKSEPFSLLSEALAWSEEEKEVLSEEKTEASSCSLAYAEKVTVVPESPLVFHQSSNKQCELAPHGLLQYVREMTMESILSEILSPVDEVLSYGSAELPPSGKGAGGSGPDSSGLPPHSPAFEIITWTSEEELPGPPDLVEDISINSESVPPLPVDLSLGKRETLNLDSKSLDEGEENNDAVIEDRSKSLALTEAPQEEEDECSEYTSSLPADESHDTEDPLSSFHIGDRVVVCNSRPGVLKYKGHTAFAGGFWAGVALDTPIGNHNGTFRGVRYFTCEKNCGVLVRAEDISHLSREHCSELDTGVDEDSFSDKDHPKYGKKYDRDGSRPSGSRQGGHRDSQSSPGHDSPDPKQTHQEKPCENDAARDIANELGMCSKSSEKSPLKVDHKLLCYDGQKRDHFNISDAVIDRLTEKIFADAIKNVQETKKRPRQRMGSKHASKPVDTDFRRREESSLTLNKPCLMDQWHHVYPETPPQIRVMPHEPSIVYKLVDIALEILCNQKNENALNTCETPSYLVDDESRKGYRQVIFQMTSDILHEVCANILERSCCFQKSKDQSATSTLSTSEMSYLKAVVKREAQKVLNLERTDQQMIEMLQTLCKYWFAKRDRVDYVLIQELHSEERQWVDYSTDQNTVKLRLAEEIFSLLLDDTISVLNHLYVSGKK